MHAQRTFSLTGIILLWLLAPLALAQQAANPPLPNVHQLMQEVREHQKQLDKVRENYTFTISQVVQEIDSKGQVSKTETTEYEVFFVHGRQISQEVKKDGKPLSEEEQKKVTERVTRAVENAEKPEPEQHQNNQSISLLHMLEIMDVRNPRRESFRGRQTIVFDVVGRKDAKTHDLSEDVSKKLQGTIWVDEADRQVARLEAVFNDNFHVGGGLVVNVQKGSRFNFDQAPVNGEIWLPSGGEVTIDMRLMLVKGIRQHIVIRDYDYKRFHVEAQQGKDAKVVPEKKP
jgi:hypothetical protein